MKSFKRIIGTALIALMMAVCPLVQAEDALTLPADLKTIEAEAFRNDTSFTTVVLPDGLRQIGSQAFAGTSLKTVQLPDSLESIADDAFDSPSQLTVTASKGTYAYTWACQHGYITPDPVLIDTLENAEWKLSTGKESQKAFAISADLGVTVSSDAGDWLQAVPTADGKTLNVQVSSFNSSTAAERTGTITVSDGFTDATLTVLQSSITGAPSIPTFSSDRDNPTLMPEGIVKVPFTRANPGSNICCVVFEVVSANVTNEIGFYRYEKTDSTAINVTGKDNFADAAGSLYRFDIFENTKSFYSSTRQPSENTTSIYVRFTEKPSGQVLINDQTNVNWNLVEGLEATQAFTVTSDSTASASSNADWLSCGITGNTLTVTAETFSDTEAKDRTGVITVTDGASTATVTVRQASITKAPTLLSSLSTDSSNPTLVPEGTVTIELERGQTNSYLTYYVYQITDSGAEYKRGSSYLTNDRNSVEANDGKAFAGEAGNVFQIIVYENAECFRTLKTDRTLGASVYVKFTVPPIRIDQTEEAKWSLSEGTAASNTFTVTSQADWSASSDADWLTCSSSGSTLTVSAAAFDSSSAEERTGIISVTDGSTTAHLTVLQASITKAPEITNLSTDSNEPTELPEGKIVLKVKRSQTGSYLGCNIYQITESGPVLVKTSYYPSSTTASSYYVNDGNAFAGAAGNLYRIDVFETTESFKSNAVQTIVASAYVKITVPEATVTAASVKKATPLGAGSANVWEEEPVEETVIALPILSADTLLEESVGLGPDSGEIVDVPVL